MLRLHKLKCYNVHTGSDLDEQLVFESIVRSLRDSESKTSLKAIDLTLPTDDAINAAQIFHEHMPNLISVEFHVLQIMNEDALASIDEIT